MKAYSTHSQRVDMLPSVALHLRHRHKAALSHAQAKQVEARAGEAADDQASPSSGRDLLNLHVSNHLRSHHHPVSVDHLWLHSTHRHSCRHTACNSWIRHRNSTYCRHLLAWPRHLDQLTWSDALGASDELRNRIQVEGAGEGRSAPLAALLMTCTMP